MGHADSPSATEQQWSGGIMPDNHLVEEHQAQLLRRIAAQDRSAVSEFYDQAALALFSFALRKILYPHKLPRCRQTAAQGWRFSSRGQRLAARGELFC